MADNSPPTRCVFAPAPLLSSPLPMNVTSPPRVHRRSRDRYCSSVATERLPIRGRGEVGLKHFHTPREVGQLGTHLRQPLIRPRGGRLVALGDTPQVIVGKTQRARDISQRRTGALLFSPPWILRSVATDTPDRSASSRCVIPRSAIRSFTTFASSVLQ